MLPWNVALVLLKLRHLVRVLTDEWWWGCELALGNYNETDTCKAKMETFFTLEIKLSTPLLVRLRNKSCTWETLTCRWYTEISITCEWNAKYCYARNSGATRLTSLSPFSAVSKINAITNCSSPECIHDLTSTILFSARWCAHQQRGTTSTISMSIGLVSRRWLRWVAYMYL